VLLIIVLFLEKLRKIPSVLRLTLLFFMMLLLEDAMLIPFCEFEATVLSVRLLLLE